MFWLVGTAFALRNFRTTATSDGSASCGLNSRFTGFWRDVEKFRGRPGPKTGPKRQKDDFPGLGGRSGRNARRTKFDRMPNADPVNPVWGPICPWGPGYGRFGECWGPFRQLGTGSVC